AALIAYDLADNLVQLRFYAEVNWCGAESDAPVPDKVDVLAGRVLQLAGDLPGLVDLAGFGARCESLCRSVEAAWGQFRAAWQSKQHRRLIEELAEADPEFADEHQEYALRNPPLAGPAWDALKRETAELRNALPPALGTCFDVGALLAGELYWT